MRRFTYCYMPARREYVVFDKGREVASFDTLGETEVYVLERSTRAER